MRICTASMRLTGAGDSCQPLNEAMLLKNATLISLAGATVERADLRIEKGIITAKAKKRKADAGETATLRVCQRVLDGRKFIAREGWQNAGGNIVFELVAVLGAGNCRGDSRVRQDKLHRQLGHDKRVFLGDRFQALDRVDVSHLPRMSLASNLWSLASLPDNLPIASGPRAMKAMPCARQYGRMSCSTWGSSRL